MACDTAEVTNNHDFQLFNCARWPLTQQNLATNNHDFQVSSIACDTSELTD